VAWPGVGVNCNACHVNNSYKNDLSPLGSTVAPRVTGADPRNYAAISPKAASCTSCHDSSFAIGHVQAFGGSSFGSLTVSQILGAPQETCNDCHSAGAFYGVDVVHGQK
jgi:OmcA/MtrC family decaheme c-type cytochrome